MATVTNTHVALDDRNVAWIDDTNIKVIEIALEKIAHGSSADDIYDQHRGYLTLAQIHAALAWYYDHQSEFDAEIRQQLKEFDSLRAQSLDSPVRQRLRTAGKLE